MSDSSKPHPAIKNFTPEQWDEMVDKLMGFTYRYFETLFEGGAKTAQTPDGLTYEDISQEIVLRVLEGARKWNPNKDGDLLPYMVGQVKSLVSHSFDSWSARNVESMTESEDEEVLFVAETVQTQNLSVETSQRAKNSLTTEKFLEDIEEQEITNDDQSKFIDSLASLNPELVLIGREYQIERESLLDTVLEAVDQANDADLWTLAEAYLDDSGEYKPSEIGARLEIPVAEFHNRRKRLVRCVKKYLAKQSSATGG